MLDDTRHTVTYCQYGGIGGHLVMKPTDIWTNLTRAEWEPSPPCKNGDSCHEKAPAGSRSGTQGFKTAAERGRIPHDLVVEIAVAVENLLAGQVGTTQRLL